MKDGHALCVSCGKEPEYRDIKEDHKNGKKNTITILEKKLELLSKELEKEPDHKKQQEILHSMNSLIETIGKLKQ